MFRQREEEKGRKRKEQEDLKEQKRREKEDAKRYYPQTSIWIIRGLLDNARKRRSRSVKTRKRSRSESWNIPSSIYFELFRQRDEEKERKLREQEESKEEKRKAQEELKK